MRGVPWRLISVFALTWWSFGASGSTRYRVATDDEDLDEVAKRYNVTYQQIASINRKDGRPLDPDRIHKDMLLVIPEPDYIVPPDDAVLSVSRWSREHNPDFDPMPDVFDYLANDGRFIPLQEDDHGFFVRVKGYEFRVIRSASGVIVDQSPAGGSPLTLPHVPSQWKEIMASAAPSLSIDAARTILHALPVPRDALSDEGDAYEPDRARGPVLEEKTQNRKAAVISRIGHARKTWNGVGPPRVFSRYRLFMRHANQSPVQSQFGVIGIGGLRLNNPVQSFAGVATPSMIGPTNTFQSAP